MYRRGRNAMAAMPALIAAWALAITGCTFAEPEPVAECTDPSPAAGVPNGAMEPLEIYGIWSETWENPPTAEALLRPVPVPVGFDPGRRIWLTSLRVAPGVSGKVSILSPKDARLFVSTWDRWGYLTASDVSLGATRTVHLAGCDGVASYPALTIVDGPECVVFGVQQDGDNRVAQMRVPFFGAEC